MEYAQLESRISFLDGEYRREKAEVAQLHHQLELSQADKDELIKRIESLEAELLETKTHFSKFGLLEGMIERFKGEMLSALEEQRLQQKRTLKEAERSRAVELETHTKAIADMRQSLERNRNMDELITLARTETDRQGAILVSFQQRLDILSKQTDEHLRSVTYLGEQRRTDTKRISELKSETTDLFKQIKLQLAKIELLEQQIPQFGQFQTELAKVRENIRAEVERVQYQHAHVERTVKSWDAISETLQRRVAEYEQRMERYAEQYQRIMKALEGLQTFQEQLKRDQHEFMELHRMNAERQKSQTEEWQSVQEQVDYKHHAETDRKLAEMVRQIEKIHPSIDQTAMQLPGIKAQINLLLKIAEEDTLSRAIAARDWQVRFEQIATQDGQ